MSEAPPPRSDPTEGRPPTPRLEVRARYQLTGTRGGQLLLHSVVELYARQGSRWARLTCRTGPMSLEEAEAGEGLLQALSELQYQAHLPPDVLDLRDDETRP